MKRKWLPCIISATTLVVFTAMLVTACGSFSLGPTPTYKINTKPVEAEYLKGKKAVIFPIKMAQRGTVSSQTANANLGFVLGLIQAGARVARAVSYNNSARKFDRENEADLNESLSMMDDVVAIAWQRAYDAETVQVAYDFGGTKPKLNHFNKPNAALKAEMANICAANNAEFAVTIMQQITHGYLETDRMFALTHICAEICVYDKSGNVVIQASAKLPDMSANVEFGYSMSPNDGDLYSQLYMDGFENIINTIFAFDSSSPYWTFDELIEGVVLELVTTEGEDDDEDE